MTALNWQAVKYYTDIPDTGGHEWIEVEQGTWGTWFVTVYSTTPDGELDNSDPFGVHFNTVEDAMNAVKGRLETLAEREAHP